MKKLVALAACVAALGLARPAHAQEPEPARVAAAEHLLDAMDMEHTQAKTMDAMIESQVRQNPQVAPYEGIMRSFFAKYISWNAIKADVVRIYASTYTEDELRQLTAFYQTPLGQRLLQTLPEISARSAEIGQRRVREHMPELIEQITASLIPPVAP